MPTRQDIETWFTHSTPTPEQAPKFKALHDSGRALALLMFDTMPANAETQIALMKLQEAVMWANTAISRGA
jgi:hypothetical protein